MKREKQDKLDSSKLKTFVHQKTLKVEKLQNGKKHLQTMSDKHLITTIYKEFLQVNNKKTTQKNGQKT